MSTNTLQDISPSVRALYRTIGKIIGRQIFDRVSSDSNLDQDSEKRRALAREVIEMITKFRRELASSREFKNIEEIINSVFEKERAIAIKQFSWVIEAYLLLNQSSTASAEVTKPESSMPDRLLMDKLIDTIRVKVLQEKDLAKVFTKDFSMNLVLTAHPTAGIQPDYIYHIKQMVSAVQKIALRVDPSEWEKISENHSDDTLESLIADIISEITLSVSHMVRAKPYNVERLKPIDESNNFLANIDEAWDIIPSKIQALEAELQQYLGDEFRIHQRFFRVHSWVARDIDGNPTVSREQHLQAIINEKFHFLTKYRGELVNLWQSLSDDFTDDINYPSKTFFINEEFKNYYLKVLEETEESEEKAKNKHQAYRIVLLNVINKFDLFLNQIMAAASTETKKLRFLSEFDIEKEFVYPLELIRANKEGVNTQEIDRLIRKVGVFGSYGSHGHSRQGAEIFEKITYFFSALKAGEFESKTNAVFRPQDFNSNLFLSDALSNKAPTVNYGAYKQRITLQYGAESEKTKQKLLQTFDLLELSELGGIQRLIISMNRNFEDMLNVLLISKIFMGFQAATETKLPYSRLEIVPLTEQIIDLRNSYKVTIDALCNKAWNEYLIANKGRFYKMRGPSDSGKQNGFVASQWEMFRSKQFDTIVVEIFNAFLKRKLSSDNEKYDLWMDEYKKIPDDLDLSHDETQQASEQQVIKMAVDHFDKFFDSPNFDLQLWKRASEELGLVKVRLINFDGWGEPVERGGGLEFEDTVKCTQPLGSIPYYERTLQGGGAQQLASDLRTRQAVQDFINGVSEIAVRRFAFDRAYETEALKLNPKFTNLMNEIVKSLRTSLRGEIFGLDLEDDNKVSNEEILRNYFTHVIKSPLVFLDHFNIASRPTSRSGTQVKEFLDDASYAGSVDKLAQNLEIEKVLAILADVRAIPYAAMFSLLGGNHVSFYGYDKLLENDKLIEQIQAFYHDDFDSQETRLTKHIIDSLERGILTADQECYRKAHEIIEEATNPDYISGNDLLILKLLAGQQSTINFVAKIKKYQVENPKKVLITELMQDNITHRDLLVARRNDAAIPRIAIAKAMAEIFNYCKENDLNPLDQANIPTNLLDLLRKAFAAGASTFGNGCID